MSCFLIRISFCHVSIALNFLLFMVLPSAYANGLVHHELDVTVEPITSEIRVQDKFYMKTTHANCDSYSFYLNEKIKIDRARISNGWKFSVESSHAGDARLQKLLIQKKSSESCPEEMVVSLSYSGLVSKNSESKNDSIVSEGFVFSGSEYFYPVQTNPNSRVTFEMEVSLPQGWKSVSQGMREIIRLTKGRRVVKWSSNLPSEDIILIGNRFYVYEEMYEGINLYAFLLKNEVRLANKYIQTAKYYIDFYSKLLGSYPYSKFALVENSKQTGYGMPSFTLMGSRIIRFPFILHSSFPHEILHNWWGNGVFIDSNSGNWSEGLTAYLADHLLLELKGKGSQYRFQEMLKYRSYVNDSNEFAINRFSHRDSMASQAIGYGKLMMVFHMLRTQLGKEIFLQSLRDFYNGYKYRHAGFREIKETFEEISGKKLDWFFEQWLERKGAPEFELVDASYEPNRDQYQLFIEVKQKSPLYRLKLPIAIWTEGASLPEIHYLNFDQSIQKFDFYIERKPQAVRLDPYNEVFRRLDVNEVPASLGQTFGASKVAFILPTVENEGLVKGYLKFSKTLVERGNIIQSDLKNLKKDLLPDLSLWVFGKNNDIGKNLLPALKKNGINLKDDSFIFKEGIFQINDHSFVFTLPRSENEKGSITWLIVSSEESIPGLIRKLPHYGKYGYLVFKGKEPENLIKGSWDSNPTNLQKLFGGGDLLLPEQSSLVNNQSARSN